MQACYHANSIVRDMFHGGDGPYFGAFWGLGYLADLLLHRTLWGANLWGYDEVKASILPD